MNQKITLARQLHNVLGSMSGSTSWDKLTTRVAWATYFECINDDMSIFVQLATMNEITDELIECIQKSNNIKIDARDMYLVRVKNIRSSYSMSVMQNNWMDVRRKHLPAHDVEILLAIDSEISGGYEFEIPDQETIKEITEELFSLSDDILDSDLNQEMKNFLMVHIKAMLDGISSYRFFGAIGMRDRFKRILGDIFLNYDLMIINKDDPEVSRFSKVIAKFGVWFKPVNGSAKVIRDGTTVVNAIEDLRVNFTDLPGE